ncbi:MAG: hypothetical protein A2V79_01180 [Betaproteobacteria bacterium RBG_16_56_24]|nr:MAG: hypothetical protein A2V79_01180 [Betaproteobacteria bacterium RBG_16_56_24]
MSWLGQTLTRKFMLLFAIFLALQAAQLGVGIFGILHIGEEAAGLVNEAGRQRYRTLLLGTLVRQAEADGAWTAERHEQFLAVEKEYERYFAEFERHASQARKLSHLQVLLAEARAVWEQELKPLLAESDPARPEQARAALRRYDLLAPEQVARLERIVNSIDRDVEEDIRDLAVSQVVFLALALLFGAAGFLMVWFGVTLPLRRLTEGARSIAAGAYDRRVAISSRDELGELAETFNRMAAAVGEKTSRIVALNEIAIHLTSKQLLRELLDEIMNRGMQLTGAQAACIAFYDQETKCFKDWVTQGLSDHFVKNMSFRPGGMADEAFTTTTGGIYILSNDRTETKHKLSKLTHEESIQSFICLPLTSHASRLGVIYFYRKDRDYFLPDEFEILNTFAYLAAGAIENARLHEQTQDLAVTDKLTGLRNRRLFDERLAEEILRAARYAKPLSLLMLDIDDFKRINDTHGHPAGDKVLQSLGQLLRGQLRQMDFAARYGGEEFTIILPETDFVGAKLVAERIRRAVAKLPIKLPDGREIDLTVSVGVACFPVCGDKAESLVEHADQALYTAKQEGKNRACLYREILKTQLELEPNRIVELLNQSLENIQPIVTAVSVKAVFFHKHTLLVERTVMQLADALGLSREDRETLRLAALLHDIGMVTVSDAVLRKQSALTAEDWILIRQHSATGADFLEQVPALRHAAPVVRHHHERYDGHGYPDGLKGEAIPYLARVLAVADTYATLVAEWIGYKARSPAEAKAQLVTNAGTQFDPQIVPVFVQTLDGERAAAG